jgi:hypothetical protein
MAIDYEPIKDTVVFWIGDKLYCTPQSEYLRYLEIKNAEYHNRDDEMPDDLTIEAFPMFRVVDKSDHITTFYKVQDNLPTRIRMRDLR